MREKALQQRAVKEEGGEVQAGSEQPWGAGRGQNPNARQAHWAVLTGAWYKARER